MDGYPSLSTIIVLVSTEFSISAALHVPFRQFAILSIRKRQYHIMMLQHHDAWDLPFESPLRKLILEVA